jgi:hypothetical protein
VPFAFAVFSSAGMYAFFRTKLELSFRLEFLLAVFAVMKNLTHWSFFGFVSVQVSTAI